MKYLTDKQGEYFKGRVRHYADMLGLNDWEIRVDIKPLDEATGGECAWWGDNRLADITINSKCTEKECTTKELNRIALHETLELLLSPIHDIAISRTFNDYELDKEKHVIIRTLENILIGKE